MIAATAALLEGPSVTRACRCTNRPRSPRNLQAHGKQIHPT